MNEQDDKQFQELAGDQMSEVAGGKTYSEHEQFEKVKAPNGECGYWEMCQLYYYPCPKCGKPLHKSWWLWFCDPCNDRWSSRTSKRWKGSVEELVAAAQ